ncbi:flagellar biosynthesis regulator FlaF [Roseibium denhamense]|uniref:Flagellar protein FlaF n=1 Tax=Roseibium denhamense TaxID=76305 RepID=A0ABY1PFM1_9HYPH|nr:flagellar biosynthesis regulator FlaF [Roseibium denhamense]MTI06238.1 flagellar biosynthesis regulator FlaF [Roseibium denhamense]SMP32740.1 flagellar protein FlaF [Roseibium denhamense]
MYNLSYAEIMDDLCTDERMNEHEAMSIVIGKLEVAQEKGIRSAEAVDAIFYTRRLWSYFLEHLADDENQLPIETRANLISVGIWVLKEAEALRQWEQEDFSDIIQINSIIRDSLGG